MSGVQEAATELKEVTRVYRQGKVDVHALRGITLSFSKGEATKECFNCCFNICFCLSMLL